MGARLHADLCDALEGTQLKEEVLGYRLEAAALETLLVGLHGEALAK